MQAFNTLLTDNKMLAIAAAVLVAALILFFLGRWIFGSRRRYGFGRSRQPRLGIVDAFDLDRTRQLVLIRRDNVEHLVMIGGPNDVLVESSILRAPTANAGLLPNAEPRRDTPPAPAQPLVPVFDRPPPPPPPPTTGPAPLPPRPSGPPRPAGPPRQPEPGSLPRREPSRPEGADRPPERQPLTPVRPNFPRTTPVARPETTDGAPPSRPESPPRDDFGQDPGRLSMPRADVAAPTRLPPTWPPRPGSMAAGRPPESPSEQPARDAAPRPSRTLGSLEDEMAKLLGRPPDRV